MEYGTVNDTLHRLIGMNSSIASDNETLDTDRYGDARLIAFVVRGVK